ncbi:MAG: hypothetical protein J6Y91_05565 [Alphaproteobacteria bacterium]|nr:hypothetical protein [Alphaproteobacteria bacterium]
MERRKFIEQGDVKSLTESTFNQKLSMSSEIEHSTYTDPLREEDEILLVEKFAVEPKVWKPFIKRYLEHYPITSKAMYTLLQHLDLPDTVELVKAMFIKYGYNEAEIMVFSKQKCSPEVQQSLLQIISNNARIFDKDIFLLLEKYDSSSQSEQQSSYAENYRRSATEHRQQRYH